jgi:hypothetical protein
MDVPGPTMDRNFECGGHPAPVFWDNGATSSCSKPIIATTNALEAVVRWYAACPYSLPAQRACCSHARPNWQLALLCMEQDSVAYVTADLLDAETLVEPIINHILSTPTYSRSVISMKTAADRRWSGSNAALPAT